jgi:hypothetical protein
MPADADIFLMREKNKAERRAHQQEARGMLVADKTTCASRMAATVPDTGGYRAPRAPGGPAGALSHDQEVTLSAAAVPEPRRRRDRERIVDFLVKKREIFLVQMSLDVKRTEIRKLEERTLQRSALCTLLSCVLLALLPFSATLVQISVVCQALRTGQVCALWQCVSMDFQFLDHVGSLVFSDLSLLDQFFQCKNCPSV